MLPAAVPTASAAALVRRVAASALTLGEGMRLEELLTHPQGLGLDTATPLQRAICRIADGEPLGSLASHPHVTETIGDVSGLHRRPDEMDILSGIRTFKSMLAAAAGIQATQRVDVTGLKAGEIPRVPIVSLDKDTASVVFWHVRGTIEASSALKSLLVCEPTADTVTLRHPTGRPVEIKVVAGKRAGGSLVARWVACAIFDEAPRLLGQEDGVVNLDDSLQAVRGRILPGGMILKIGSPWAPFGPIHDEWKANWHKPTDRLVIVKSPAHYLNPVWWTPARMAALKAKDPQAYKTDVLAEFSDVAAGMFPEDLLERVTRSMPRELPRQDGCHYVAAMDPATRGNAWAFGIAHQTREGRRVVDLYREWQGSSAQPLSSEAVMQEIARECKRYGIAVVRSDQWAADALADIAIRHGVSLQVDNATGADRVRVFDSIRGWAIDGRLELPPDPVLADDLKRVRRRITQTGIAIELPRTSDGRHCDGAAMLGVLMAQVMIDPEPASEAPRVGTPEHEAWRMEQAELDAWERERAGELSDL